MTKVDRIVKELNVIVKNLENLEWRLVAGAQDILTREQLQSLLLHVSMSVAGLSRDIQDEFNAKEQEIDSLSGSGYLWK